MRCHITTRLALFSLLPLAACFPLSILGQTVGGSPQASSGSIILVENSLGRQVYTGSDPAPAPLISKPSNRRLLAPTVPRALLNLIDQTADRHQIDPALVRAVIRVESGFDSRAVSSKGAEGLMQLIPATAERFGVADPFDSRQNIEGGVSYLRYLLDRFNGSVPLSLAAYNAGENRVDRDQGIPSIPETINYVRKVTSLYRQKGAEGEKAKASDASAPIYRTVDAWGVPHFSND